MKVKMTQNFTIRAPIGDVWDLMTDIKNVSSCIPGAQYVEDLGDNCHSVMLTIKVGPIKTSYRTEVSIRNLDVNNHTLEIEGRGTDVKGKGGATMEMVGSLTDSGDGTTQVSGDSSISIQGMLAQFGSRMINDVSNQLFEQFTASLRAKLEGNGDVSDEGEPDNTLSGMAVASAAIKGAVGRLFDSLKKKTVD